MQKERFEKESVYSAILVSPYRESATHFKIVTRNPSKITPEPIYSTLSRTVFGQACCSGVC